MSFLGSICGTCNIGGKEDEKKERIDNLERRITELEKSSAKLNRLDDKIDRLNDKLDMKFELIFLHINKNGSNL